VCLNETIKSRSRSITCSEVSKHPRWKVPQLADPGPGLIECAYSIVGVITSKLAINVEVTKMVKNGVVINIVVYCTKFASFIAG
jgi:hypothetical protein